MRDFGSWSAEQGKSEPVEVDGTAWFRCCGCGKQEVLTLAEYRNGDTAWYVEDDVEPDGDYEGVCGGSQFCFP